MAASTPTPPSPPLLAVELREKRSNLRDVEARVDILIEALFAGWRSRFPTEAGWRFTSPATLDVYDVILNEEAKNAIAKLGQAGFETVVLHDHNHDQVAPIPCECPRRSP